VTLEGNLLALTVALALAAAAGSPLRIEVDKARVDLAGRKLEVKMNHPAGRVELKVFGPTGNAPLVEAEQDFSGRPPGEPLVVSWPDPRGEVARIDLRAYDRDGLWVGVALIPWSVTIPHEEVNFATDSAAITPVEAPKLEGSLKLISEAVAKHHNLGPIKLFIAGHTDTVGAASYNLRLSQRRAQAIAGWFRNHGLRLPIYYEGFGEQALLVATPDETDELRNRRVDYILAIDEPPLASQSFHPVWKSIP
jgi:outer membrane protein OmpA-like peptidoglycan-associated protein